MEGDSLHSHAAEAEAVVEPASAGPRLIDGALTQRLIVVAAVAVVVTLGGCFIDTEAGWAGLIVAGQYALGLSLGGLLFLVFGFVTRAGWSVAIRRVPEALATTLPYTAACVFVILLITLGAYEWTHTEAVESDPLLQHKSGWLSVAGVLVRSVLFLGIWIAFAWMLRGVSRRQDDKPGEHALHGRAVKLSCGFLVVFALTYSFAAFDWVMSLEPHWYSTVYAVYNFSSLFLSSLAAIAVIAILLERAGPLRGILRDDHLHDLGKLMLGFATFWAYIWFCQYMLIWYSNIPEETTYYVPRMNATWGPWMVINVGVNWLIPFLLLLPRPAKRNRTTMLRVAVLLLAGRWLDLHLMVAPPLVGDHFVSVLWGIAPLAALLAGFTWFFLRGLGNAKPVPEGDPYLGESLHYHA